ncbi:MAG: hypothetical protein ACRDEA_13675, partial [Microcystaceae cyanobacterium]
MKLNSRIASISVFLIMMLGAGIASAWWGFTIGHEALKGVSQPDVNPAKERNKNQQASAQSEEFKPVSEKEILTKVQAYINRQDIKPKPQTKKQTEQEQNPEEQTESQQPRQERTQTANFPLTVQDRGVTLE